MIDLVCSGCLVGCLIVWLVVLVGLSGIGLVGLVLRWLDGLVGWLIVWLVVSLVCWLVGLLFDLV